MIPFSLVLAVTTIPNGFLLTAVFASVNGIVHELSRKSRECDFDTVNYAVAMIQALERVKKLNDPALDAEPEEPYAALERLRTVLHIGGVSAASYNDIMGLIMSVFLVDMIVYEYLKFKIEKCHRDIQSVHEELGRLDSAIASASWQKTLDVCCEPDVKFSAEEPFVNAIGMVHPLLTHAVPNDLHLQQCLLITGSNASGKSTFLKTTALCVLLAQALCITPCEYYSASAFRLYTSMMLSDRLLAGESYYIAETKAIKRILDQAERGLPALCMIDEVLRGTNTVERITASTELLSAMSAMKIRCIAATHDIELCDLLAERFALAHFEETVENDAITFDYRIHEGRAVSHNAIELLRIIRFPNSVVDAARKRAENYMVSGKWM